MHNAPKTTLREGISLKNKYPITATKIKPVYSNGVITDSALNPGDIGSFSVAVDVPRGAKYEYETYDIHWENIR